MNDSLTIDKLRKAMEALPAANPYWDGTITENLAMVVTKFRGKTWRERLFSWPWKPWRRLHVWSEPDPNMYRMLVPDIFGNCAREVWVAHPATAQRIRTAVARQHGNTDG